ncbi:MAG: glycosyltransferase [Firmicutes bacterium]|nr:glycosyltransferase [Bacillota bacterium]MDY5335735.1 glycosyltransferase [Bacilli bacterium]
MSKIKVSVIVPVYNVERYLEKCLDSLINQTLNEIEIILVNDGSTDNSERIILQYKKKYNSKIILITQKNGGQSVARNTGLKAAKGEYITFVDSDDWLDKTALEKTYKTATKEKADIVTFGAYTSTDGVIGNYDFISFNTRDSKKNFILNKTSVWGLLIKRKIILDNNLFFPEIKAYEDIAVVSLYGLFANKIVNLSDRYYYYLIRQGSTMNQLKYNSKLECIFDSMNYLETLYKTNDFYDLYNKELEFIYIEHFLHASSLRVINYKEGKDFIKRVSILMKEKFPSWNKNKYYKEQPFKYKVVCNLIYHNKISILKKMLK